MGRERLEMKRVAALVVALGGVLATETSAFAETIRDPTGSLEIDIDAIGKPWPCVITAAEQRGDCDHVDAKALRKILVANREPDTTDVMLVRFEGSPPSVVVTSRRDMKPGEHILPRSLLDGMLEEMKRAGMALDGDPVVARRTVGGVDALAVDVQFVSGGAEQHLGALFVPSARSVYVLVCPTAGRSASSPTLLRLERGVHVDPPAAPVLVDKPPPPTESARGAGDLFGRVAAGLVAAIVVVGVIVVARRRRAKRASAHGTGG